MTYDTNNIFAKILRQEIPCKPVFEDKNVLAFHDITPKATLHILIIPKGAYINFHDFHDNALAEEITSFYQAISHIIAEQGLKKNGYRLINNCGIHGGQEVPHYHIHLLGGQQLGPMVTTI